MKRLPLGRIEAALLAERLFLSEEGFKAAARGVFARFGAKRHAFERLFDNCGVVFETAAPALLRCRAAGLAFQSIRAANGLKWCALGESNPSCRNENPES